MAIQGMNHFTVLSSNLMNSKKFYVEILGLKEGHRPDLSSPGAWLYVGGQAILHIMAGKSIPEKPAGVIDHIAFSANHLQQTIDVLKQHGIAYDLHRLKDLEIWQLFFHDPDGAKIELDFPANEPEPK